MADLIVIDYEACELTKEEWDKLVEHLRNRPTRTNMGGIQTVRTQMHWLKDYMEATSDQ